MSARAASPAPTSAPSPRFPGLITAGLTVLLAGCAAGPRAVPEKLTPAERLAFCEEATLGAKATASFEIDSEGSHQAHFSGTLELTGSNALQLGAEGKFDHEDVRVDLESMKGDINRSVTRGSSFNSHHRTAAPELREAVAVGLVRMGLLHSLALLVKDADLSNIDGGAKGVVKTLEVKEAGLERVDSEPCHRLDYSLLVDDRIKGEATLCVADLTGLPVQRRLVVHFDQGDLTDVEHYKWKLK
jgi:hypothetical protein